MPHAVFHQALQQGTMLLIRLHNYVVITVPPPLLSPLTFYELVYNQGQKRCCIRYRYK